MKKTWILFSLSFFLIQSPSLMAKKYEDKGFSGSLNFLYNDTGYKTTNGEYSQKTFTQEYQVNYLGNIYSPKLLDYSLDGTLRYEERVNIFGEQETTSNADSQDYKVRMSFIKDTKAPFSVYTQKSNRPTSTSYSNDTINSTSIQESKGINGYIDLKSFNLGYSATEDKNTNEAISSDQETQLTKYDLSLTKSEKDYSFKLGYMNNNQDIKHTSLDSGDTVRTNSTTNSASMSYRWKISDTLEIDTGARYLDSQYLKTKSTSLDANLRWSSREKYIGSIAASTTLMTSYMDVNDTDVSSTSKNMIASQSFGYIVSQHLSFSQSMAYSGYDSEELQGKNVNFGLGAMYNKTIFNDTYFSFSLNGMNSKSELIKQEVYDQNESLSNESLSTNSNLYSLSASSSITNMLPSINSKMSTNVNYNGNRSDDKTLDGFGTGVSLSSSFWLIFNNNMSVSYFNQKSSYTSLLGDTNSQVQSLSIDESLDFALRLGIRGKITTKVGIRYSEIENNSVLINRTQPKADIGISYRFWQRLRSVTTLHVDKDLSYDIMNYDAATNFTYKIGRTFISAGYQYSKTESSVMDAFSVNREKSRLEAKLVRKF